MSFQSFSSSSHELLNIISEALFQELQTGEVLNVVLQGEETDYLRFTQSKIRQNTSVTQRKLSLHLQKNKRSVSASFSASGNLDWDLLEARGLLQSLRTDALLLPEDSYQVEFANNGQSRKEYPGKLLSIEAAVESLLVPAQELDMAGLYTAGTMINGNRNSKGQRHWFATESFFVDYSLYNGERAVKACYSDREWDQTQWQNHLRDSEAKLQILNRPRKKIMPGKYKVYLAPGAVAELSTMFDWQGLSYRAYKDGANALKKLKEGTQLSPLFSLRENFTMGLAPQFNDLGELAPETLPVIEKGQLQEFLVNSRTAKEFGMTSNQAGAYEATRAMEIAPGTLKDEEILGKLETGLYLSNLHYINWSDLQSARVTGMTRYACLWVENGEVVAPIEDMRFDVSLYEIFGANLLAVTEFQRVDPNVSTYEARGLGGRKLPGMLIENFNFTL